MRHAAPRTSLTAQRPCRGRAQSSPRAGRIFLGSTCKNRDTQPGLAASDAREAGPFPAEKITVILLTGWEEDHLGLNNLATAHLFFLR